MMLDVLHENPVTSCTEGSSGSFIGQGGTLLQESTQQRYDFLDFMLCCRRINTLLECSSIRKRIIIKVTIYYKK